VTLLALYNQLAFALRALFSCPLAWSSWNIPLGLVWLSCFSH
jgi:hypothetical protein